MKATFENTVDILVKAYLNDTLIRGNCCACAVGNLVAHGLGLTYILEDDLYGDENLGWKEKPIVSWRNVFMSTVRDGHPSRQFIDEESYYGDAKLEIDSTGYHYTDLARIEKAFESNYVGDDPMFSALCAVVDVLAEIHGVDLTVKENAKLLFVKP